MRKEYWQEEKLCKRRSAEHGETEGVLAPSQNLLPSLPRLAGLLEFKPLMVDQVDYFVVVTTINASVHSLYLFQIVTAKVYQYFNFHIRS